MQVFLDESVFGRKCFWMSFFRTWMKVPDRSGVFVFREGLGGLGSLRVFRCVSVCFGVFTTFGRPLYWPSHLPRTRLICVPTRDMGPAVFSAVAPPHRNSRFSHHCSGRLCWRGSVSHCRSLMQSASVVLGWTGAGATGQHARSRPNWAKPDLAILIWPHLAKPNLANTTFGQS